MGKLFQPSEEMLALRKVLSEAPMGAYIPFKQLAEVSGVKMDGRGKALMRSALRGLKRYYRSDHGKGIELACPGNTMPIVSCKAGRVSSAIKTARKVSTSLYESYVSKLDPKDRERLGLYVSVLAAVEATSKAFSGLGRKMPELSTIPPDKETFKPVKWEGNK